MLIMQEMCIRDRDNREYLYCLAKRKDIKVYDMSMHEYNFELEGEYCDCLLYTS